MTHVTSYQEAEFFTTTIARGEVLLEIVSALPEDLDYKLGYRAK